MTKLQITESSLTEAQTALKRVGVSSGMLAANADPWGALTGTDVSDAIHRAQLIVHEATVALADVTASQVTALKRVADSMAATDAALARGSDE